MHYDCRAVTFLFARGGLVLTALVANPMDRGSIGVGACYDLNALTYHERRIKSEAEVTDNTVL